MMAASFSGRALVLMLGAVAGSLIATGADAAPPVANSLESRGLKPVGSLFLLTNETDIHAKVIETKALRQQLLNAEARQRGYGTAQGYQQAIKNINNQISQLKAEIQNVAQRMNQLPRGRRGFANSVVSEQYSEFQIYRNQLQVQVNETTAYLNQLKSQPFDPKTKTRIDAEVAERRQTYDHAVVDLRGMIDKAQQTYLKLAADDTVKSALYTLGRSAKIAPKLGPSHEFSAAVKWLEKLERETAHTDSPDSQQKHARGARTSFRNLRPAVSSLS